MQDRDQAKGRYKAPHCKNNNHIYLEQPDFVFFDIVAPFLEDRQEIYKKSDRQNTGWGNKSVYHLDLVTPLAQELELPADLI